MHKGKLKLAGVSTPNLDMAYLDFTKPPIKGAAGKPPQALSTPNLDITYLNFAKPPINGASKIWLYLTRPLIGV